VESIFIRIITPQASFCSGDGKVHAAIHLLQKTICNEYVFWYSEDALVTQTTAQTMDTAAQGLLSRDEMESRRLLAAQDLQTGLSQSQVARKFGVSRTTASRWNRSLNGKGVEALRKRRAPGRPSRLTAEQLLILTATYQAGPRAAGFETDRWTTSRFADAIFAHFGVRYDPDHAGRIMHRLGLRERRRSRKVMPDVLYTFTQPAAEPPEVQADVA
jgi:transposase